MSPILIRKTSNRIWKKIANGIAALLLAVSSFCCITGQLGLKLTFANAFKGGIGSGLACAWNTIADTLGSSNYMIVRQYAGASEEYGLFLLLSLIVMIVVAVFVVKSRIGWLLLLFVLPPILIGLLCGLYPAWGETAFLAVSAIFALVIMKMREGLFPAAVTGILLAAVMGILIAAGASRAPALNAVENGLSESIKNAFYGMDDLQHGNLTVRKRSVREGTALEVTMSEPQSMYLKGFTGATFNGQEWSDLSNSVYYENREVLEAIRGEGFHAAGQLAQTATFSYDEEAVGENTITVTNTGADQRYAFVPYDILEDGTLSDVQLKGGTEFFGTPGKRFRSYTYTASSNQVDNWTDAAARLFTQALNAELCTEEMQDYLRLESYFNKFVYENFGKVSKAEHNLLSQYIGGSGDQSKGHVGYKTAIKAIRSYLENNFIYTEDLGARTAAGKNELKDFLESGKGYDVQFATAATLMFRYFGIPARYVEGYLITPDDAAGADADGTVRVLREHVHAWTEIYIDGVGFVPLEVTPEYYGVMEEADMETGISNEALVREFQEHYGEGGGSDTEEEEPQPAQPESPVVKILLSILVILAGLVVLALLVFLCIRLLRKIRESLKRRRLFLKSDPKTAVAAIYDYMESCGLHPGEDIVALGNLAAYSPQKIKENERGRMLEALKALKKSRQKTGSLSQ